MENQKKIKLFIDLYAWQEGHKLLNGLKRIKNA
jgi:hypothetical protein